MMTALGDVVDAALILSKMNEERKNNDFNTPQINVMLFQVSGFAEGGPARHDLVPETVALMIHSFLEFLVGRTNIPRDLATLQPLLARCVCVVSLSLPVIMLLTTPSLLQSIAGAGGSRCTSTRSS